MSQETLIPQTTPSHSLNTTTTWFPTGPPPGYEALPCDISEDHDDVELGTLGKPSSSSDVDATPIPGPIPGTTPSAPKTHGDTTTTTPTRAVAHPSAGPMAKTRPSMLGILQMLAILLTAGLPTSFAGSLFMWLFGLSVLNTLDAVPSIDAGVTLKASMAGAPVVALVVGAGVFLDFSVRRLPRLRRRAGGRRFVYRHERDTSVVFCACAPASVFAMPLGFLMMPGLATETFGAWHALVWSLAGISAIALFCIPYGVVSLWSTTVKL